MTETTFETLTAEAIRKARLCEGCYFGTEVLAAARKLDTYGAPSKHTLSSLRATVRSNLGRLELFGRMNTEIPCEGAEEFELAESAKEVVGQFALDIATEGQQCGLYARNIERMREELGLRK